MVPRGGGPAPSVDLANTASRPRRAAPCGARRCRCRAAWLSVPTASGSPGPAAGGTCRGASRESRVRWREFRAASSVWRVRDDEVVLMLLVAGSIWIGRKVKVSRSDIVN